MINTLPSLAQIPTMIIMALAILFLFVAKAHSGLRKINPLAIFGGVLVLSFVVELMPRAGGEIFFGMLKIDSFSSHYNLIFYLAGLITLLMITLSGEMNREIDHENLGLVATIMLGMMCMAAANHLLIAVIGIELVSLPSYLLVAHNRKNPASKEASLKYVLFGSFAAAIMLYGMSLIFGLTGSLDFASLWKGLGEAQVLGTPVYHLALLMTLSGMAFKIAAAPFHFWCPDAYQAAPTPVTAFLSVAPKVAGLALIMRFLSGHLESQSAGLTSLVSIIAMLTMTVGNLAALKQKDIKRLLAYSSISHAGFLLMGIAVLNQEGRQMVFFYIPIYLLMNLGAFMSVIYLSGSENFQVKALTGMIKKHPLATVAFTVCLFSLAGIPPFAGFIGKFYFFKVALQKELFTLVVVAGLNSVVSLYYYVGIIRTMIVDEELTPTPAVAENRLPLGFVAACAVPLVFLGVYWQPLLNWAYQVKLILG